MYMKDWIERLENFLKMTGKEVLQNAGTISHEQALKKAEEEYEKFKEQNKDMLTKAEEHFLKQIESAGKQIENKKTE